MECARGRDRNVPEEERKSIRGKIGNYHKNTSYLPAQGIESSRERSWNLIKEEMGFSRRINQNLPEEDKE